MPERARSRSRPSIPKRTSTRAAKAAPRTRNLELDSIHPPDRAAWRAWLQRNHATSRGVWLVYSRKSTGKPRIRYEHTVEEALCFGWIDGLARTIDADRYARRFTPRAKDSEWSALNLKRVKELETAGLMTPAGMKLAKHALEQSKLRPARPKRLQSTDPPPDFRVALSKSAAARRFFEALAPGYKLRYLRWITEAKQPETRARRIREAIDLLARNVKSLMK